MPAPPVDNRRPSTSERIRKEKLEQHSEPSAPKASEQASRKLLSPNAMAPDARQTKAQQPKQRGIVQQVRALHRSAGNQAIQRMLEDADLSPSPPDYSLTTARDDSSASPQQMPLSLERSSARPAADADEQEATRFGDLVRRTPSAEPLRTLSAAISDRVANAGPYAATAANAPPIVRDALGSPGHRLDVASRRALPAELRSLLADVRIHTDSVAARSADALGADAYTVGRDIVFAAGSFAPHTAAGRGLIAHEAAHVGQQAGGAMTGRVQAQSKPEAPAKKETKAVKVTLNGAKTADQIADALAQQYFRATRSQVAATIGGFNINRDASKKEIAQGWVIVHVPATMDAAYNKLEPDDKKKVDEEANARFQARTGRDPTKLGTSKEDKALALQREYVRDEVLWQRQMIDKLPDDIKKALFAGGADDKVASPASYTQLLNIAQKLAQLTPEQRRDYLARVNAETTSLSEMERSVDTFIEFQRQREEQAQQIDQAAKPLLGGEDLFSLYKSWRTQRANVAGAGATKGAAKDKGQAEESLDILKEQLAKTEAALLEALKKKNFNSIAAFEAAMETYRVSFRTQAVNLALDLIARYEHTLFEGKKKFEAAGSGAVLTQGIAATDASKLYAEAHEEDRKAAAATRNVDPTEKNPNSPRSYLAAKTHQDAAQSARERAEKDVIRGSGNDPIVSARGTNREYLAGLDPAAAQAYLRSTIDQRAEEAKKTRDELRLDPEKIFSVPDLVEGCRQIQGIEKTNIYGMIVQDHIDHLDLVHKITALATIVLAIALAILVPVGGWVAAAALVGSAVLSTYQALEAYSDYERDARNYNIGFIQEEPSLLWVGLAIVGAAIDIGVAGSIILKEAAPGLKALEGPLRAYAEGTESAESLIAKIEATDTLRAEVRAAMARELKVAEAAEKAIGNVAGKTFALGLGGVSPELVEDAFHALYYSVKRGVNTITKLRKDKQLLQALGDVTRMSGAELHELEAAFEEVKQLVKTGQARKMDDEALLGFVDRWSINRRNADFKSKLLDEMKAWKPLTAEQKQTLNALEKQKSLVSKLYQRKRELLAERDTLVAIQKNPATRTDENLELLQDINKELRELDPSFAQKTTKKAVTTRDSSGNEVTRYVDVPIEHPPGKIEIAEGVLAKSEREAQQAQVTLYDRLRAAAPSEKARDVTLKGAAADQIGGSTLKTTPGPLQAEHIVSVREIADMDGFAELPWKDQKAIVDMRDNLIAMDRSANLSKGDRTWTTWPQASNFYEAETIATMVKREATVRKSIQDAIAAKLPKKLPAVKP